MLYVLFFLLCAYAVFKLFFPKDFILFDPRNKCISILSRFDFPLPAKSQILSILYAELEDQQHACVWHKGFRTEQEIYHELLICCGSAFSVLNDEWDHSNKQVIHTLSAMYVSMHNLTAFMISKGYLNSLQEDAFFTVIDCEV